jgi:hypothetical protein
MRRIALSLTMRARRFCRGYVPLCSSPLGGYAPFRSAWPSRGSPSRREEPLGILADFGQEAGPFFGVSDLAPSGIQRSA